MKYEIHRLHNYILVAFAADVSCISFTVYVSRMSYSVSYVILTYVICWSDLSGGRYGSVLLTVKMNGRKTWVTAFFIDVKLLSQQLLGKVEWTSVVIAGTTQIWNKVSSNQILPLVLWIGRSVERGQYFETSEISDSQTLTVRWCQLSLLTWTALCCSCILTLLLGTRIGGSGSGPV